MLGRPKKWLAGTISVLIAAGTGVGVPQGASTLTHPDLSAKTAGAAGTPAQVAEECWTVLTTAADDTKHPDIRIQALAALGTMAGSPRAVQLVILGMRDPDVDVRTAAVLAAGQTRSRTATTSLRELLNDKEPQVAFAAATTLWKLSDRSGEDVLMAVADGERSATAGLVSGTRHTVIAELHHPEALARMGAMQGASMLLGPFGFGLTAFEYIRKNGGDGSRVLALEDVAENHTEPIRRELLSALTDKDVAVRAAAAKALGEYHDRAVQAALAGLLLDAKLPVRLTGAAAYLRSVGPGEPAHP